MTDIEQAQARILELETQVESLELNNKWLQEQATLASNREGNAVSEAILFEQSFKEVTQRINRLDEIVKIFRRHAASHDLGAPLRFSVQDSRELLKKVTL